MRAEDLRIGDCFSKAPGLARAPQAQSQNSPRPRAQMQRTAHGISPRRTPTRPREHLTSDDEIRAHSRVPSRVRRILRAQAPRCASGTLRDVLRRRSRWQAAAGTGVCDVGPPGGDMASAYSSSLGRADRVGKPSRGIGERGDIVSVPLMRHSRRCFGDVSWSFSIAHGD